MQNPIYHKKSLLIALSMTLLITLLFILDSFTAVTTQAHGGGTPRLTDMPVGPYRRFVWSQPEPLRAGEIHLTIGLTVGDGSPAADKASASTEDSLLASPITDATVAVRMVPADAAGDGTAEAIEKVAVVGGLGAVYYETDAILPTAGHWRFIIEVSTSETDGSSTIEFREELLAARTLNVSLLVGAGLLFLVLIGLVGIWNRQQRAASSAIIAQ